VVVVDVSWGNLGTLEVLVLLLETDKLGFCVAGTV
jgi:hypothetical protein